MTIRPAGTSAAGDRDRDRGRAGAGAGAVLGGRRVRGVVDHVVLSRPGARLGGGFWAVVGDFEGDVHAWRFASEAVERTGPAPWLGPRAEEWTSSLDRTHYIAGVSAVRDAIREGDVYQVNLCRVLSAPLGPAARAAEPDPAGLAEVLAAGNPAPYAGWVHVPVGARTPAGVPVPPVWVVSASPELFLRVAGGVVTSGPIKGTARTAAGLTAKDEAENVMITDMVRNDLQRVCRPGTVEVTALLAVEHHPGLVHLVSTV
ncbi:MAG TPA: chorismate-binding protein, partial [Actinotalea sp.]|nr:chorismate-binding protein [Actinotalea sp.]